MQFELLGPLRVRAEARELVIRSGRERTLLAVLLLQHGDTVPWSRLVEAIWNGEPPSNARNQLQGCVSRLRRLLSGADHQGPRIVTDPAGYRVLVEPNELDLWEYRRLWEEARSGAGLAGAEASRLYRAALGLWRGPALADVDSDLLRPTAAALDEERLQVLEECIEVELELGRSGRLVGELSELTTRYPYREGLHGALMLALYRSGQQADALAAYRHARQILRDELGTEPTRQLQQLHQAILGHDPSLGGPAGRVDGPPPSVQPRELPPAIVGFTGRAEVIDALDHLLGDGSPEAPVAITVLTGTAGVGKTALAVHWAHRVSDRLPDGQLYLNLRGHSAAPPLPPSEALSALLRSLGTPPEQIPTDLAEAAARFRSRLAGKRVLILLDDADTAEQVRPLLPGSRGCVVLVTSRNRLTSLVARDGAWPVDLDVFNPDEAQSLLTQLLGTERVRAAPVAAHELAKACAYLPLALRIAAATLRGHPHQTIERYVADLISGDRLAALQTDDDPGSAVQAALAHSYRALPDRARRLFRLLGLVPGPDFTPAAAAALADSSVDEAADLLDRLARCHLVSEHAAGRYSFHDLLRLYAIRLCQADHGEPERTAALERLLDSYLRTADAAATRLHPVMLRLPLPPADTTEPKRFDQASEALAWFDAEQANLVAAIVHNAENRLRPPPWLLADRLRGYFRSGRHTTDWLVTARASLAAAERDGDPHANAAAQFSLAHLHACLTNHPAALAHYSSAIEWAARAGWRQCQAASLCNLGIVYQTTGQLDWSASSFAQAIQIDHELEEVHAQAVNRVNLGFVERERGRLRESADQLTRALAWDREHGDRHGEAFASEEFARTLLELGQLDRAQQVASRAVSLYREAGDRGGEVAARYCLAAVHDAAGRPQTAFEIATRSVELAVATGDVRGEADAINVRGRARLHLGDAARAIEDHRRALELARHTGICHSELGCLIDLATAQVAVGEWLAAAELARSALNGARTAGYRNIEGRALTVLAEARLHDQDYLAAREHATDAVDCHHATGCRLGEAQALTVLGQVQQAIGDRPAADRSCHVARERYRAAGARVPAELVR